MGRSIVHPPAAGAGLTLAVEVDGGDRRAEVVELGEVAGADVLPPPRGVHRLAAQLLEEQEHQPVDPEHRPRALVAHHLGPWTCIRTKSSIRFRAQSDAEFCIIKW